MRVFYALVLSLFAGIASAQEFPALFNVVDVAGNDVLNIRSLPANSGEIIGALDPNQIGVEVLALSDNGRWGLVNAGERTGWAFMRYLSRQPGQTGLADFLLCSGTEPFWTVELTNRVGVLHLPGDDPVELPALWQDISVHDRHMGYAFGDGTRMMSSIVRRAACSDGMSDRDYGFATDVLVDLGPGQRRVLSGCCSLEGY